MEFKPVINQVNRLTDIVIESNGETVSFALSPFNRTKYTEPENFCVNMNAFVDSLDHNEQLTLFALYADAKEAMDNTIQANELHLELTDTVTEICNILDFENRLQKWFQVHGQVTIPELDTVFQGDDSDLGRSLTYLKDEYLDLTALSLFFKFLTPIFSQYLTIVANSIVARFREYKVLSLLHKLDIFNSKTMVRLLDYVYATIERERRIKPAGGSSSAAIYGGLSTDEVPNWLLARTLIRRLTVNEEVTNSSLIANLYHTLDQQLKSLDKTFGGTVKDNKITEKGNDENNSSIVENYKIKQRQSQASVILVEQYCSDIQQMVLTVDPTVPKALIKSIIKEPVTNTISEEHVYLTQMCLWKVLPVRAILTVPLVKLHNLVKASRALLTHWGMTELLHVMYSNKTGLNGNFTSANVRPKKEIVEIFSRICPYRQTLNKASTERTSNPALMTIENISELLKHHTWVDMKGTAQEVVNYKHCLSLLLIKTYEL